MQEMVVYDPSSHGLGETLFHGPHNVYPSYPSKVVIRCNYYIRLC
jgi:hypothetical protein